MINNSIALGTAQLAFPYGVANRRGRVGFDEAKTILEFAAASGMDTLDTAVAYGESEELLGKIGVKDWRIISKLPAIPDGCCDISRWGEDCVRASLQRLNVECLYGLLLHRPKELLGRNGERLYRVLRELRDQGIVRKIGVSIYDPDELDTLWKSYEFDIVQVPFNVFDGRLLERDCLRRSCEHKAELHVRSVFLQGLLLMKPEERPSKFDRWGLLWSGWDKWLEHNGLTPLEACIRYALSFHEISRVIVGVEHIEQLKEILIAARGEIPPLPDWLKTDDDNLVNPSMWDALG